MFEQQVIRGLAGLHDVARHDHGHIGQPLHGEQVFQCLMRSAVRANRDSSVRSGNQDVQVCVAH